MDLLWGIDLGGTKIEGIVAPREKLLEPIARIRLDTGAAQGYGHILDQIQRLVSELISRSGAHPSLIGFGTPGVLDAETQTMKNCNTTCLNGKALKSDLQNRLGVDVRLANDANCFTLAESRFGSARGSRSVFGVIMGTGVGGGLVLDGKIWPGYQGIAGEWGHNQILENGEVCYCGKQGCVETVISGPGLERFYSQQSGSSQTLAEIMKRAASGADRIAVETQQRLLLYFSKAISVVINILDPEFIVLGGGVSNVEPLYSESSKILRQFVFNNRVSSKIVKHALGDSAGVFGAALQE